MEEKEINEIRSKLNIKKKEKGVSVYVYKRTEFGKEKYFVLAYIHGKRYTLFNKEWRLLPGGTYEARSHNEQVKKQVENTKKELERMLREDEDKTILFLESTKRPYKKRKTTKNK